MGLLNVIKHQNSFADNVIRCVLQVCAVVSVCVAIVRNIFKAINVQELKVPKFRGQTISLEQDTQSISLLDTAYAVTTI